MAGTTRIRAVLFDLYNTLIEIQTDERGSEVWRNLARIVQYYGLRAEAEPLRVRYNEYVQTQLTQSREEHPEVDLVAVFAAILRDLGYSGPPQLAIQITQLFRALSMRRFGLFADTLPVLRRLHGRVSLGVISDAQRVFLEPEMQQLGLEAVFSVRVVSSDYGYRKPDPRLFRIALAALDVPPSAAVYIGDHPFRDICGAQAAGMRAVLLRRGTSSINDSRACPPDRTVSTLDEALNWIAGAL